MSVDSRILKHLYREISETAEQLQRTIYYLTMHLDDIRMNWSDGKADEVSQIITECLEKIQEAVHYLRYTKKYLRSLYHFIRQYEEINLAVGSVETTIVGSNVSSNTISLSNENIGKLPPSIDEIRSWIRDINPKYRGDPYDPFSMNCGSCALAVFRKLEGGELKQATTRTYSVEEINQLTGRVHVPMTPEQIRSYLIAQGIGAHAVIGIDREGMPGHWFNAYYDGEDVYTIDGQTGMVGRWPPYEPCAFYWDIGI